MRRRLCTELEKEKDFELQISLTLKENMLEMWQMETEQGKYEILHEQLKKSEEELEMQYQERAKVRISKEKIAALQAEENQRSREKIHERNAKEEVKTREHMERRIQAVLSLKTSIASNREKLRTRQVWNKAMALEAKKQEMKMREAILAEGGNVAKEIFLHKRLLEHEKEKHERTASVGEISEETPHDVLCESDEDEEERDKVLVEPEFPGLWSQECDLHKISKEEMDPNQLEKKREEFQTGISHKQIVSGRERKGRTFYSKPSCIHFQLALDKELIDFGSHVVGETISRTINLTNSGALGTRFKVQTSAGDSSTWRATAKPSLGRMVPQHFSACVSEKKVSNNPVTSVVEKKERICSEDREERPCSAAQEEPQRVEMSQSDSSTEQLGQDVLNSRSALDADNAHNLVELSAEETPVELMLGKVTEGEIGPFSSVKLQILFVPTIPGDAQAEFVITFDNPDCKPEYHVSTSYPAKVDNFIDQAKKVNFTVHAIVTTSDLEVSPAQINFGYCTIYEAVRANVKLTNKSILPQEFGFVGLPEFVEIQPNDGLGILLPLESLTLDIIFKANKAKVYSFELTCKSEINRQFKLSCKAVGVHPPLELSHSLVQFAATALNGVSTATLYVMNAHVSVNPVTHPVPRIGKGEVAPVGPTSFEFRVPEACPVTITPSVGTVLPGKLGFSVLNPNGPFLLVRPVKMLEPGENKTLIISFCPNENEWFFDVLDIRMAKTSLTLSITGRGVMPTIVCSVGEVLDVGYVVAREKGTSTFKIRNTSPLTLRYSMQLDSLSSTRDKDQQKIPSFITSPSQRTEFVGTQNYNGLSVFSIFPTEGEIVAGKSQDFTVTFSPDHESLYYSDRLKVVLFGKSLEFSLETPPLLQQKGFTIEAAKGTVERGQVKRIGVSWVPPADCRADDPLLVTALLTLRSDIKETYQILFMAKVVSACAPSK
ncbi:cilia- and flagella-associated protein 74 [Limosa lapponica baueri]|uniref:Cilia-and flagella-associated protein 74 n=1 Tax=Limosa lapponica baueri TaxID=1758121 RepID=A0A2I0TIW7_LIMLA|nr:cilia- and flagella-associated protein 74 [Limosa lapponica baueri]